MYNRPTRVIRVTQLLATELPLAEVAIKMRSLLRQIALNDCSA